MKLQMATPFIQILFKFCLLIGLCHKSTDADTDDIPLNAFSTKTAYRNQGLRPLQDASVIELKECRLVHINALFRHGTRFPSKKDVKKTEKLLQKLSSRTGRDTLPSDLLTWRSPFPTERAKHLTKVGAEEMNALGQRFASRFGRFTRSSSKFYASSTERSVNSAIEFSAGMFHDGISRDTMNDSIIRNDSLIRFFDYCQNFIISVENNKTAMFDFEAFGNGPEMAQVVREIVNKSQLNDINVTSDDVRLMHSMCAFELANNISYGGTGAASPWCKLLSQRHYLILEFWNDLKHYWRKANGYPINYLQSCPLLSSMINRVKDSARLHAGKMEYPVHSELSGEFWFGHAETVFPVVTLLGLFNQSASPPSAGNYDDRLARLNHTDVALERFAMFRGSSIAPFGGNVALALYFCPHLVSVDGKSGYRVQPLVNEQAVPWYPNLSGHLSLEELVQKFAFCEHDHFDHGKLCTSPVPNVNGHSRTKAHEDL